MNCMVEIREAETTPAIHLSMRLFSVGQYYRYKCNPEIRDWTTVESTVYLLYDAHVVGNAGRTALLRYYVTYNRAC